MLQPQLTAAEVDILLQANDILNRHGFTGLDGNLRQHEPYKTFLCKGEEIPFMAQIGMSALEILAKYYTVNPFPKPKMIYHIIINADSVFNEFLYSDTDEKFAHHEEVKAEVHFSFDNGKLYWSLEPNALEDKPLPEGLTIDGEFELTPDGRGGKCLVFIPNDIDKFNAINGHDVLEENIVGYAYDWLNHNNEIGLFLKVFTPSE